MENFEYYDLLLSHFSLEPTESQEAVIEALADFLAEEDSDQKLFLLKGYAGTGKTTLISTLVKTLASCEVKTVLLAPTGRAAKVMSTYSKKKAYTLHKCLYVPEMLNGELSLSLRSNRAKHTLFIVDEASMIGERNAFGGSSLLSDLIEFVYTGENCSLMLIGDTAQLPPIHTELSPALDEERLSFYYHKEVTEMTLTEVVRQGKKSGILYNATQLRKRIAHFKKGFQLQIAPFRDIVLLQAGYEIEEALTSAYQEYGREETTFIVRSNKRAVEYNQQIRTVSLGYEAPLCVGDLLMVVKNNYLWLSPSSQAGFIANGDIIEILEINGFEKRYGYHFAQVLVSLIDYPSIEPFETLLLLDTLESPTASLSFAEQNALYQAIITEYNQLSGYIPPMNIKQNPYYNALQVKYSYCVTCHKSQGGQWDIVFIEKPFLPDGESIAYFRWLYTALTRAKEKVYLVKFPTEDIVS